MIESETRTAAGRSWLASRLFLDNVTGITGQKSVTLLTRIYDMVVT